MLSLQQSVVEAPPLDLALGGASAADRIRALAQRVGVHSAGAADPLAVFEALLDRMLSASLAPWIVDWVCLVCADAAVSSDDPTDAHLLSTDGVLCVRTVCCVCGRCVVCAQGPCARSRKLVSYPLSLSLSLCFPLSNTTRNTTSTTDHKPRSPPHINLITKMHHLLVASSSSIILLALATWAMRAAGNLRARLTALLSSADEAGELARVGSEADALLQVSRALKRAGGSRCVCFV